MAYTEEVEELKQLIQRAQQPQTLLGGGSFVIVPKDNQIQSVDSYGATPVRKIGNPKFCNVDSLIGYVNEQKDEHSRIYVASQTTLIAILDHHTKSGPRWGQHRPSLELKQTPEWLTWRQKHGTRMMQREFAAFIEDNSADVTDPAGADLLDLVRTIKASQNVECTGKVEELEGNTSCSYSIETKAKAGIGAVELPSQFTIASSIYEGGIKAAIHAKLKFEVTGGKLCMWFELQKLERFEKASLEAIVAKIQDATELTAWYGTP